MENDIKYPHANFYSNSKISKLRNAPLPKKIYVFL